MSFCFNFDVHAQTTNRDDVDGKELQKGEEDGTAKPVSNIVIADCMRQ